MNIYDVAYRNKGRQLEIYRRSVMADSLESAIGLSGE